MASRVGSSKDKAKALRLCKEAEYQVIKTKLMDKVITADGTLVLIVIKMRKGYVFRYNPTFWTWEGVKPPTPDKYYCNAELAKGK